MKILGLPVFIIASLLLMSPALAVQTTQNPNPDMSSSEVRATITVPVGFYYGQENTSYFDIPHFEDFPTPWNTTSMAYNGDTVTSYFNSSIPNSIAPYVFVEAVTYDNTTFYHIIADIKIDDSVSPMNSNDDAVFFQLFDADSTNTTQTYPVFSVNVTDIKEVASGFTTSEWGNQTYVTSPIDASFMRYEADLDASGFVADTTFLYFEISRNGNWEGNFELTNFEVQKDVPAPPTPPATPDVTGTPAVIVQIIALVVALGGIIGGGLFIQQSGRIDGSTVVIGFVVALLSIIFAVAIVGLV